ncbi:FAD-dependent oxidoreductase [Bradyrhizobium sp. B117]|uniref:NAD(P)/FAD-dependent oxidoreductase n=1 Tax=Bradyrhizobium sp. B117 TaxID=3140246 RepID=UPI00318369D0
MVRRRIRASEGERRATIKAFRKSREESCGLFCPVVRSGKCRVAILGAGRAGVAFCSALRKLVPADQIEIALVDRNDQHELTPILHLVAAGLADFDDARSPIIPPAADAIQFACAGVRMIQLIDKMVLLDSSSLSYDILIIALGATTSYFRVKGARANALPLRSTTDAATICTRMAQIVEDDKPHRIIIVGGGATGVSLAAALCEATRLNHCQDRISIVIVEAKSRLLSDWPSEVSRGATEVLVRNGVTLALNARVEKVAKSTILTTDGRRIDSALTLWTAGVIGSAIRTIPKISTTCDRRLKVDGFCKVGGFANVFAIGDIAAMDDMDGNPYPQLGQVANQQADYLARQIARSIAGDATPPTRFQGIVDGRLLSLGTNTFIGQFRNYTVQGTIDSIIAKLAARSNSDPALRSVVERLQSEELDRSLRELADLKTALFGEVRNLAQGKTV